MSTCLFIGRNFSCNCSPVQIRNFSYYRWDCIHIACRSVCVYLGDDRYSAHCHLHVTVLSFKDNVKSQRLCKKWQSRVAGAPHVWQSGCIHVYIKTILTHFSLKFCHFSVYRSGNPYNMSH